MRILEGSGIPYLVGGAYAFRHYTGITRDTRDFDVFVLPEHIETLLALFESPRYRTEFTFRHWLGKIYAAGRYVDMIFSSGNGIARVDPLWFEHANPSTVLGRPALVIPAEEMIWSKAFIMERERFDGADIAHVLRARAETLDWDRLLWRFGPNGRVLLAHLILFGFIYPGERNRIPETVLQDLMARLDDRPPKNGKPICQGTLLSRSQYLPDLEWGYRDARLRPWGAMTTEEVAVWTEAAKDQVDPPRALAPQPAGARSETPLRRPLKR